MYIINWRRITRIYRLQLKRTIRRFSSEEVTGTEPQQQQQPGNETKQQQQQPFSKKPRFLSRW